MIGTYKLDLPDSKTSLTIRTGYTFEEIFAPTQGATVACSGQWSFSNETHHITLHGSFVPRPPNSMLPGDIDCTDGVDTMVIRDISGVYLEVDPDGEANFRKFTLSWNSQRAWPVAFREGEGFQ